ncbi:MAG: Gfo/Idh/MocA family oxidoreductase, partial [Verrucomicrobiae bacterium]|nr:Gfo/Idh/MocA family oxidoreductase [Verrucomicrobiae bacterium]
LARSGTALAGSALAGLTLPRVHAGGSDIIRLALIGCGNRGCGAAANAFDSPNGPVRLIAMADLFPEALDRAFKTLAEKYPDRMDVPRERRFAGFDAYKKAMDCLQPGDVAMLTGYSAFRPAQLEYAVERGVNVFMEKSFGPDAPALRRIIRAGEQAAKKNLKIAAGLQCRHSVNRHELIRRIRDGAMGQVQLVRSYRMQPVGTLKPKPPDVPELRWQLGFNHFIHFLWVSGGLFAEMNIHQIDEMCWILDAWPVSAHAIAGRAPNSKDCSQNLDSFAIEWTFANGAKGVHQVRWLPNCHTEFATYIHGTKCAAQFSGWSHVGTVHLYKDQRCANDNIAWRAPKEQFTPWEAQWNNLLEAIRHDKPFNEAKRAALSNIADLMGRAAAHMGRVITWDEMMNSNFQFCPNVAALTETSEPPVRADAQGCYPVPVPGEWNEV